MIAMFGNRGGARVAHPQRHRDRARHRLHGGEARPTTAMVKVRIWFMRVLACPPAAAARKRGACAYEQDGD